MKNPEPTPPGGRLVLRGHIWLLVTLIPLFEKLVPFRWLLRLLTPPRRFKPYANTPPEEIARLISRCLRAPRLMRRRACLRQGLALFHFLKLAGWPAILRIGVFPPSLDGRRMHAHCWVTLDDVPLSPPPQQPAVTLLTCGIPHGCVPTVDGVRK